MHKNVRSTASAEESKKREDLNSYDLFIVASVLFSAPSLITLLALDAGLFNSLKREKDWNTAIIEEFRTNGGKVAAFSWATLLLLTTTGAKSGKPHTTPVVYLSDEGRLIICATAAGSPQSCLIS